MGPGGLELRARHTVHSNRSRAAEKRDERAALHSITSSAVARSDGGTVSPSAFAAFRLMTSSNLVDCTTGRSAGFSPGVDAYLTIGLSQAGSVTQ